MTVGRRATAWAQTEWSTIGVAPGQVRASVGLAWALVCFWLGQAMMVEPTKRRLDHTQARLEQVDQRVAVAKKAIAADQETLAEHQQTARRHRRLAERMTRLASQHAWLSHARGEAAHRGLTVAFLRPAQRLAPLDDTNALDAAGLVKPLDLDWMLSQQGLNFFDVELQATGRVLAVLDWLQAAQTARIGGRVMLHWATLIPEAHDEQGRVRLQARFRVLGLPSDTPPPHPVWASLSTGGSGDGDAAFSAMDSVVWQSPGADWWQALPLDRLRLVGIGHLNDQPWAWVLDPTGRLRALSEGSPIGAEGRSVVAIESDGVTLSATGDQSTRVWTWQ